MTSVEPVCEVRRVEARGLRKRFAGFGVSSRRPGAALLYWSVQVRLR
jgi:hypothetical protein